MNADIRKKIYLLLFGKPICNYVTVELNAAYAMNVLIAGDDDACFEAFKAVYWCGQMPDNYSLNIKVLSENPDSFTKKLTEAIPAIGSSAVSVNFSISSRDSIKDIGVYNYCFISSAYSDLIDKITSNGNRKMVCLFTEKIPGGIPGNVQTVALYNDSNFDKETKELDRYAFNCDYAYRMNLDERCEKGNAADFAAQGSYEYLSSLAFPVHIPYKLAACASGPDANESTKMQALYDAIDKKNDLYYKLLELEHRRWTAYMISEGWRAPTAEELQEYAFVRYGYDGGFDQRNKIQKLHPIICRGSARACLLDKHDNVWNLVEKAKCTDIDQVKLILQDNYPDEEFSELEIMTLVLYGIVCAKAYAVYPTVNSYFDFMGKPEANRNRKVYEHLHLSARKLAGNDTNSGKLFNDCLRQALSVAQTDKLIDKIEEIKRVMTVFVEKNIRKNYFMINSTMIEMIPFCLWYGKKYKTVVTFSSDLAVEDVKCPTILCAEKAVYISNKRSEMYEAAIKAYFADSRRNNTEIRFIYWNLGSPGEIFKALEDLWHQYDGIAINCVANNPVEVIMTIGAFSERYNVPVLTYSFERGVKNLKNGEQIGLEFLRKSLSVDEIVDLMGGSYTNVYQKTTYLRELDELEKLFIKYSKEQLVTKSNDKTKLSSAWSSFSSFFQEVTKNSTPPITKDGSKKVYEAIFDKNIVSKCGIDTALAVMERCHVISGYSKKYENDPSKSYITVRFNYYNDEIKDLFDPYRAVNTSDIQQYNECLETQLAFYPSTGLSIKRLAANDVVLIQPDDPERTRGAKISFVHELKNCGIISELKFSADGHKVSLKFADHTIKDVLKKSGQLFELILYYKIRNSGLFADAQTSVKIAWEYQDKSRDDYIMEHLRGSSSYGYGAYKDAVRQVDYLYSEKQLETDNEIDLVLSNSMTPVFISCKTGAGKNNDLNTWLYEIASVSARFNARPVLAVTKNLDEENLISFLSRARKMGVTVIGYETIFDDERFIYALNCIKDGKTFNGKET